jgi:hypothetical protein
MQGQNINGLNRVVQDGLNNQGVVNGLNNQGAVNGLNNQGAVNGLNNQGSIRNGVPVNSNVLPPIPPYTTHNQTNNNFSGRRRRRNAIVPGQFQGVNGNRHRQRANTQVRRYNIETNTDPLDQTTHPSYNP